MVTEPISELVDSLVIGVHMAVPGRHGASLRPILERWALPNPGVAIDLAEFVLAGSLTDDVALARFPFLPPNTVIDGLSAVRAVGPIAPDLQSFLDTRAETAAVMWPDIASIERATIGAIEALGAAVRPLAVAYRALPLPDRPPMRLHHLLTGLRYERLGAHVQACDRAGLTRPGAVALSTAWSGEGGPISAAERELRNRIEVETETGCEPMWSAVTDLDGWLDGLAMLGSLDQSSRPASS